MADELNQTPTLNEGLRLTLNLPEIDPTALGAAVAPQEVQPTQPAQELQQFSEPEVVEDKPVKWGSKEWTDVALSPIRGVLAAGQSAYELMDTITFDALPDIQGKIGGRSETDAGKIIEGITQFAVGFGVTGGVLGAAFKGAQAVKLLANPLVGGAIKGAVTDFSFMDAHQERLANLIQSVPELQNPIAAYLASDKDEGEIEGRIKNALEGLGVGVAVDAAAHVIGQGLKALKKGQKARLEGAEPQAVADAMQAEIKPIDVKHDEAFRASPTLEARRDLPEGYLAVKEKSLDNLVKMRDELRSRQQIGSKNRSKERATGLDAFSSRVEQEINRGKYGQDLTRNQLDTVRDFAKRVGEDLFSDIKLSIKQSKGDFDGTMGNYANGLITIYSNAIKRGSFTRTNFHELFHHISRFSTDAELDVIRNELVSARKSFASENNWFNNIWDGKSTSDIRINKDAYEALVKQAPEAVDFMRPISSGIGKDTYQFLRGDDKHYRLTNLDEMFAERMADLTEERFSTEQGGIWKKAQSFIVNAWAGFKKLFGANSSRAMFNDIIAGKMSSRDVRFRSIFGNDIKDDEIDELVMSAIRGKTSTQVANITQRILQTAKTSDDIAKTIKAVAEVVEARAKEVRPSSWQDLAAVMRKQIDDSLAAGGKSFTTAEELLSDVSPLNFAERTSKALAARRLYSMHIEAEATRISDLLNKGEFTDDEAIKSAELLHAAYKIIDADKKLATTSSRALSSRRKSVFDAVAENKPVPMVSGNVQDAAKQGVDMAAKQTEASSEKDIFKSLFNNNFKEYLAQDPAKAKQDLKRVMDMLARGDDPLEVAETAAKSISTSGRIMDTTLELFINNLFSLKTCVVNSMSGSMQLLLRPLEIAIGRGFDKAGRTYMKQAYHQMTADMSQAIEYFKKSFVEERGTFGATQAEVGDLPKAISADYWNIKSEQNPVAAQIVNGLGRGVRVFSATNQAMDSAIKFLGMRSNAAGRFMHDAYEMGLQGDQAKQYVSDKLKTFFNERGLVNSQSGAFVAAAKEANERGLKGMQRVDYINNRAMAFWDKNRDNVGDFIQQQGREITNTRDFGKDPGFWGKAANDIAALVKENPPLRFFVPFVKTPAQLLRWVAEHTPTAGPLKSLNKTTVEELASSDPLVRAGAQGRLRVGTALWASAGALALSGKITGYGPNDPRERKALMATGWKPYAFKLGDSYIQFNRLDPIASFFGIAADVSYQVQTGVEQDDSFQSIVFQAAWLPLQQNFTNKTYMRGFSDMLDLLNSDKEDSIERAVLNRIAVLIPGGLANSAAALGQDFSVGSSTQTGDYLLRRIPGLTGLVDRNRNILGEAIDVTPTVAKAIDAFNPFVTGYDKGDKVVNELANLRHPFSPPPKKLGNVVDLTSFNNNKGQTAYDRYSELVGTVEVRGATLRKEMSRLFASRQYKALPTRVQDGEIDARVTAVNRLISKYRAKAREQLLKEFPEVAKAWGKKQILDQQSRKSVKGLRSLI